MQIKQALAEADAGGDAFIDDDGWSLGKGIQRFCPDLNIPRIAHQEERRQITQDIGQTHLMRSAFAAPLRPAGGSLGRG